MKGDVDGHEHIALAGDVDHRHMHIGEVDHPVRALNLARRQFILLDQSLVHLQRRPSRIGQHAVHQPVDGLDLSQEVPIVTVFQQGYRLLQVRRQRCRLERGPDDLRRQSAEHLQHGPEDMAAGVLAHGANRGNHGVLAQVERARDHDHRFDRQLGVGGGGQD